jgi:hypothetical protein
VAESAITMESAAGETVEVWTISSTAATVRASAPRLTVRRGMVLSCRVLMGGSPYVVSVRLTEAEAQSEKRAALVLEVVEVRPDWLERGSERFPVSINASLTALVCDRVVPGDVFVATITDLSEGGVGLHVGDGRLRSGDLLQVAARCFAGTMDEEITVRLARRSDMGALHLGCAFRSPSAESLATVRALLNRANTVAVREPSDIRAVLAESHGGEMPRRSDGRGRTVLRPAWEA